MGKHRKHYTPEEKVAIIRRHLGEKVPVSDLCQEQKLQPTVFYRWLKEFFENGAAAFRKESEGERKRDKERIAALEAKLKTNEPKGMLLKIFTLDYRGEGLLLSNGLILRLACANLFPPPLGCK